MSRDFGIFMPKHLAGQWHVNSNAISSLTLTHKGIEELDFETRIRKRDELLTQKFSNNEQK